MPYRKTYMKLKHKFFNDKSYTELDYLIDSLNYKKSRVEKKLDRTKNTSIKKALNLELRILKKELQFAEKCKSEVSDQSD